MSRYLDSIDSHLATLLAGSARAKFLAARLAETEERYRRFVMSEGDSEEPGVMAADFLLRLSDLQQRFDRVKQDELRLAS